MLKHADYEFKSAILKLFNIVLRTGLFPEVWSEVLKLRQDISTKLQGDLYKFMCRKSLMYNPKVVNHRLRHRTSHNTKCRTTHHSFTLNTLVGN